MPAIPTITSAALLSMLGMNTHINWNTKAWDQPAWPTIEADVAYLGVHYLRDAPPMENWTLPEYVRLARQGVHFDVLPGPDFPKAIPGGIDALVRQVPGAIAAVEGPNEINLYETHFAGIHSMHEPGPFAKAIQPALYAMVRADPNLKGVPVYNLTLGNDTPDLIGALGDMTNMADVANWHPYAGRLGPRASLRKGAVKAVGIVRNKPLVFTEGGYCGDITGAWCSVNRAQQAAWTLDLWLEAASMGARIYVYELTDNDPRSSPTDAENGFGMFDYAGHPYPVATAIHNLNSITADGGVPGKVAPLEATIDGEVRSLALAKSNGSSQLILWNEGGAERVTVTLPDRHARMAVYDPLVGTDPVATMTDTATARLTVTDHPLVLSISAAR